jgi:hypothetical protein
LLPCWPLLCPLAVRKKKLRLKLPLRQLKLPLRPLKLPPRLLTLPLRLLTLPLRLLPLLSNHVLRGYPKKPASGRFFVACHFGIFHAVHADAMISIKRLRAACSSLMACLCYDACRFEPSISR